MPEALSVEVEVRPLRADETQALARCFERCYGDSYVDPAFHDPALLRERVEKGAHTPDVDVVSNEGRALLARILEDRR